MSSSNLTNSSRFTILTPILTGLLALFVLAGCAVSAPVQPTPPPAPPALTGASEYIDAPDNYVLPSAAVEAVALPTPTPEPVDDEPVIVMVKTQGSHANLRSAPDLDAEILGKGNPGTTFEVVGRSEDGEWWEVCCVQGEDDTDGEATVNAWVAASVVSTDVDAADVAVSAAPEEVKPILPDELDARWEVDWQCGSDRCTVAECRADVTATATDSTDPQWLPVDHVVEWEEECFPPDQWVFEINRFGGAERTGDFADNFLYGYWLGAEPGELNGVYTMDRRHNVAVNCSDSQSVEINEGDGWTSVYEGRSCHDVQTGMLVLLNYTKRWLYTGEYDGRTYDRAYFGDSERLEQRLVDTNVELLYVEPAK